MSTRWGAHAPSRAGHGALAIANFIPVDKSPQLSFRSKSSFRRGAETSTRGRVRSP
jgi:hypothetical protein